MQKYVLKDFAIGCLSIIILIVVIPVLYISIHMVLWLAIPTAIIICLIVGVVLLGKITRLIFGAK